MEEEVKRHAEGNVRNTEHVSAYSRYPEQPLQCYELSTLAATIVVRTALTQESLWFCIVITVLF